MQDMNRPSGRIATKQTTPDPHTGTARLDVWASHGIGNPDMARGIGYSARYIGTGEGADCAQIETYVIECEDGFYGVEECVTIGKMIVEDGEPRPSDDADIEYDWASALSYETEADAQKECDRIGMIDYSFALYLSPNLA